MSLRIFTSPQADIDLVDIYLHIADQHPDSAEKFLKHFENLCELLATMPTMGSWLAPENDLLSKMRLVTIPEFRNFVVVFLPKEDRIEIIRVVHGSRDLEHLPIE